MFKSILSGISGLLGHQSSLDAIGNNIANLNTTGFKSSRVSFSELMSDGLGLAGGSQAGSGVGVASVDTFFGQGAVESTGRLMDLAIEGDGFFSLELEGELFFSRAGEFGLDEEGRILHLGSGALLRGTLADSEGRVSEGGAVSGLQLDLEQILPAEASSFLELSGILNQDSEALGTHLELGPFFEECAMDASLLDLSLAGRGASTFPLLAGEVIRLSGSVGGGMLQGEEGEAFLVAEDSQVEDLISWLEDSLQNLDPSCQVDLEAGRLMISGNQLPILDLALEVDGNSDFEAALEFSPVIEAGGSGSSLGTFLQAATAESLLADLYNASGEALSGLESEFGIEGIDLLGEVELGGQLRTETLEATGERTLTDLMTFLEDLTASGDSEESGASIDLEGRIHLQGHAGLSSELTSLSLGDSLGEVDFLDTFRAWETQSAREAESHVLSLQYVDLEGESRSLSIQFTRVDGEEGESLWTWQAESGELQIRSGGSGTLSFDSEGELEEFRFDGGFTRLEIMSEDGRAQLLDLQVSESESIRMEEETSRLDISGKDWEVEGTLEDLEISEEGIISGRFSNGTTQTLARIELAHFRNNQGMKRLNDNLYSETGDSGRPLWMSREPESSSVRIIAGALEKSNVDLAREFTQMITTQRGFQANARVISIGDEMLSQAIRLKR